MFWPEMTAEIRHDWTLEQLRELHATPLLDLVFQAASVHRQGHNPREMQVSKLISIKTGACPEDCAYCAQSSRYSTVVSPERLMEKARVVEIAARAKAAGISQVCFDRGAFRYHGRVAALANAAREAGLEF